MDSLKEVRAWALSKLAVRSEPRWAVEQYRSIVELCDEILATRAATISLARSRADSRAR